MHLHIPKHPTMTTLPTDSEYLQTRLLAAAPLCFDETCPICNDDWNLAEEEIVRVMDCDHVFHRECVTSWFDPEQGNSNTCPMCRCILFSRGVQYTVEHNPAFIRPTRELLEIVHLGNPEALETIDFDQVSNPNIPVWDLVLPPPPGPPSAALVDLGFGIMIRDIANRTLADTDNDDNILDKVLDISRHVSDCWEAVWRPQRVLEDGCALQNYLMAVIMRDYANHLTLEQWATLSRSRRDDFVYYLYTFSPSDIPILSSVREVIFRRAIPDLPEELEITSTSLTAGGSTASVNRLMADDINSDSRLDDYSSDLNVHLKRDTTTNGPILEIIEEGLGTLARATDEGDAVTLIDTQGVGLRINFARNHRWYRTTARKIREEQRR